ncbi:MAG TPA: cytochrome c maturation protein CcmE [Alphaproteobacteria bacterium]
MTRKRRRLYLLALFMVGLGTATALTLMAFQDNLVFFYSPSDLLAKNVPPNRAVRIGGLVEQGSVERRSTTDSKVQVRFRITDLSHEVAVVYVGIIPDLFREGQGVVANGKLGADGVFQASELLAKHDEKYMPPEVADALKKSGRWQETGAPK